MGISAVAVLRISSEQLSTGLAPAPEGSAPAGWTQALFLTGKNGTTLVASALADAVCVHTGASFAEEAEELSAGVRAALGDLLDAHHDSRGIFFFPDIAKPQAGETYDALVERVGDAGQWAPLVAEGAPHLAAELDDPHHAMPDLGALAGALGGGGDLGALLGNVMASLDPSMLQQMQQVASAMFAGDAHEHPGEALPDAGALEQSVKAMMGSPANLEAALKTAQDMMAKNPELQDLQKKLAEDLLRKGK